MAGLAIRFLIIENLYYIPIPFCEQKWQLLEYEHPVSGKAFGNGPLWLIIINK